MEGCLDTAAAAAASCSFLELFLGLEPRGSLLWLLPSSREPLLGPAAPDWTLSVFLGLWERSFLSALRVSEPLWGLAGCSLWDAKSLLLGWAFLSGVLGLVGLLWWLWGCWPAGLMDWPACSLGGSLEAAAVSRLGGSSGADVLVEEGDGREVEKDTEEGEAGEDCSSKAGSLGMLEGEMLAFSFIPANEYVKEQ